VSALVAAELLKLRTIRSPFWLVVALVLVAGLAVAGAVGADALDNDQRALSLADAAESVSIFAIVVGVLLVTNEYRHGTITPTFLVTPARERVVAAKAAAALLVGLVIGAIVEVIALAVAIPWLSFRDEPLAFDGALAAAMARLLLAFAVATLFGVAVGLLVRSQIAAVVGVFAWLLVVEPVIMLIGGLLTSFDDNPIARSLPGSALDALVSTGGGPTPSFAAALPLALVYLAALGTAGTARAVRGDAG
jgi:ABC-2 type transport system permease protein